MAQKKRKWRYRSLSEIVESSLVRGEWICSCNSDDSIIQKKGMRREFACKREKSIKNFGRRQLMKQTSDNRQIQYCQIEIHGDYCYFYSGSCFLCLKKRLSCSVSDDGLNGVLRLQLLMKNQLFEEKKRIWKKQYSGHEFLQ